LGQVIGLNETSPAGKFTDGDDDDDDDDTDEMIGDTVNETSPDGPNTIKWPR